MNNTAAKKIAVVTIYAAEHEKESKESAMAWYTRALLFGMPASVREEIVVISNIKKEKKIFQDEEVEVNECWHRGGMAFGREILAALSAYPELQTVHIQHEFNLFGGPLAVFPYLHLLRGIRQKVVVTYHGVISQKTIDADFKKANQLNVPTFVARAFFSFVYKISRRYIDTVIVHEAYFKNILVHEYGFKENQVVVLPIGIEEIKNPLSKEEARKKLEIPDGKKTILFFGFLAGYKGVDLLLEAFSSLDPAQYFLLIAGGKPKRVAENTEYNEWFADAEKKIQAMGNAKMTGFVPDDLVSACFAASDLLVLPYIQMLSASGPMSLSIASGTPFVASDVFSEVLENKEIIFQRNPESLKIKIQAFFDNKELYIRNVEEMKKGRSWNEVGAKTAASYFE